ncbi:DUF916 and DUF3324 domain-containing protein [Levilactobacillus mulengensis]|uniref:DUF916 and DUF3324 domain-containing protein n=1 Tax=Levilactobacillus mulengensis TaxID=2486025 RepID=UPI000F7A7D99|nr:DUF916 and DUF3324 domain-containing protein [Levilactobacillus mulengensis]
MQGLKKIQFLVLAVFSLILGGLGLTTVANAAGENEVGYSVKASIPKNQINKKNSFFDLKMASNQTEYLKVRVYNVTNQDIQVKTAIHTAWTSSAGAIEYVKPASSFDSSLRYKMSDISKIQGKSTLTIPAGSSKVVTAKVQMPKTSFKGVILGGWYFKRVDTKVTGDVKGASNLRNSYSYVVGMKYTMGNTTPNPDMKLGKVAAGLGDYHRGVFADLRNPTAVIIPNLNMKTTITDRDGGKVIKQATKKNVQMAPNTTFRYPMYFGKEELKAGHYHLHMVVKNTDRTWVFDRNFTITAAQAAKFNRGSVESSGISLWLVLALGALGMLILILLILLIIYLIRRNKKKQEDQAED